MQRVAELGCCIGYCEDPRVELHHIGNGTMGKRSSNFHVIPLCAAHHRTGGHGIAVHASGREEWIAQHGTEEELLEQVLRELGYNHGIDNA